MTIPAKLGDKYTMIEKMFLDFTPEEVQRLVIHELFPAENYGTENDQWDERASVILDDGKHHLVHIDSKVLGMNDDKTYMTLIPNELANKLIEKGLEQRKINELVGFPVTAMPEFYMESEDLQEDIDMGAYSMEDAVDMAKEVTQDLLQSGPVN